MLVARSLTPVTPSLALRMVALHGYSLEKNALKVETFGKSSTKDPSPSESPSVVPLPPPQLITAILKLQGPTPPIPPRHPVLLKDRRLPRSYLAKPSPPKSSRAQSVSNASASSDHKNETVPISVDPAAAGNESASTDRKTGTRISIGLTEGPSNSISYRNNPTPIYPQAARRRGIEGTVLLAVVVDVTGLPLEVEIKKSSGVLMLDDAACKAVQHWRFEPARRVGQALIATVEIPIRFHLTDQ